jgi:prepilin-type N-terminal cleavage/methylation domain-containing protein
MNKLNTNQGFSLVELSVVLLIIGAIASVSLSLGSAQQKVARIKNVDQTMEVIKTALKTYRLKNNRYPCPALLTTAPNSANYGIEEAGCDLACPAGLTCNGNAVQGFIPFKTIGLSEAIAYDSWGSRMTYVVDKTHTANSTSGNGTLAVQDAAGNEITNSTIMGKAIYILLSHGSDMKGGYGKDGTLKIACSTTAADSENCDGDAVIKTKNIVDSGDINAATYFNDHVSYESQNILNNALFTAALPYFTRIFIGGMADHVCGLKSDNKLYCWGSNYHGELGFTTTYGTNYQPKPVNSDTTPWLEVGLGNDISCGIKINGLLYCWGNSSQGSIGDGLPGFYRVVPTLVSGGFTDWKKVSSSMTVCAIRGASGVGVAYCWGENNYGQIGDGTTVQRNVPTLVSGGFTDWIEISSTRHNACGIRSTGELYCWGRNHYGQIGDGTSTDRSTPTLVSGGFTDWTQLSVRGGGVCGIRATGELYCWGINNRGQIGDGTSTDRSTPTLVSGGLTDWIKISVGEGSCGLRATGALYCWGSNHHGQIGDGTTTNRNIPTLVSGGFTDWQDIKSGSSNNCGIRANKKIYCWGHNHQGKIGDGTTTNRNIPTLVSGQ